MPIPSRVASFSTAALGLALCQAQGQVTRQYDVVALQAQPAPSAGLGASYGILGVDPRIGQDGHIVFGSFSLNTAGQIAVGTKLRNVPLSSNEALFVGTPGDGYGAVLRENDPFFIAGVPGDEWGTFDKVRLNDDGSVLFESRPGGGGTRSFFVRRDDGTIDFLARDGQGAVGVPGSTWDQVFVSRPALGGNDIVALNLGLDPDSNFDRDGIWTSINGVTELLVRKGQEVPGFPGQTFDEFQNWNAHRSPAVNSSGTVVFRALGSVVD